MTLTKVLQKVISVTLSAALMLWQCGFAYAVNVSDWDDLKYYTEIYLADVNVTSALTAADGYPAGTLQINTNGLDITGSTLTHNSANNPLIEVDGEVTSFSVSNNLVGDVVNNGVMTYAGTLSGKVTNAGTLDGSGTLNLSGASSNSGSITQSLITQSSTSSSLANTGNIYTRLSNEGTVNGTGSLYLSGASSNSGTINQALISQAGTTNTLTNTGAITAKVTNSGTISGTGSLTLASAGSANLGLGTITQDNFSTNGYNFINKGSVVTYESFANAGGNITGEGSLDFAEGTASNTGNITQNTLINAATFTNTGNVTAALSNTGTITGTGNITLNADSVNNGTITQSLVTVTNGADFLNHGLLMAKAHVLTGNTMASKADDLGGDVENDGTLDLDGDGTLSVNITGTGSTKISNIVDNSGSIDQTYIKVKTGSVVTTNASNFTADNSGAANTGIENEGVIKYTAGTTANKISGTGRTDITGYVTNTGDITQDVVTNSGVFTNDGNVEANFKNTNDLTGTGSITTGTGVSSNSGSFAQANLVNNGTFDNNGHMDLSDKLTNYGTFTTNADLLVATNGIENESTLVFNGGTNWNNVTGTVGEVAFTGNATNYGAITQAHVANTAELTNSGVITAADVYNTGKLTTLGGNIVGNVENLGTYVISDGNNANDIIGAGGTTTILGSTTNTGTIMQETLKIANSGNLTTDSTLVTATVTNDGKLTWNAGATNENIVNGTGELQINGTDVVNTNTINQGAIKVISGSLTTNADLLASANGITNNDGLIFNGGTNTNAIDGSGDLTITDDVTNKGTIKQGNLVINNGDFTTDADLIDAAITNNDGLYFTGGANANDITGAGTTFIDGDVANVADISTEITVTSKGHYTTATDVLADLENYGTTDIIDANISGDITGTGTTNILGTTFNNATITQGNLNIASTGVFGTNVEDISAVVTNDGNMTWNAGTANANVINGSGFLNISTTGTINNNAAVTQGNITIFGGTLSTNADLLKTTNGITNNDGLTFTGGTNTNAISGSGDLTIAGDVLNQGAINQNSLTVNSGMFTSDADLLTFANGITNDSKVSLTGGTNTSVITGSGTTYINDTVTNNGTIDTKIGVGTSGHYATTNDINKDLDNNGTTDITNADINADITGTGTTNILGITTNNGNVVQSALNIASNATFGTDIDAISAPITNEGSMIITGGTTNANVISGNGSLDITGGDINNTASISQNNITITGGSLTTNADLLASANGIANDANLTFNGGKNTNAIIGTGALTIAGAVTNEANILQNDLTVSSGMFTTNADLLALANPITNNGGLTFTGGTNINDITGTGLTYIEGTVTNAGDIATDIQINAESDLGTLTDITTTIENRGTIQLVDADVTSTGRIKGSGVVKVMGDTTNYNQIAGSTINVAAGGQLTTDSTKVEGAIANQGKLVWNAGDANANAITGTGVLEITGGDIVNTASISQDNFTITGGAFTSNANLITSANGITNNANLTFNGGTNANAILGTGALTTTGDVINQAAITQASLTNSGNFVNISGDITTDLTNSGLFLNMDGTITGDITNTGDFLTQGNDVIGNVANNGTYTILNGNNANDITGAGSLGILGNTTNTGVINQNDITIASGAKLIASDMDDITTTTGIDNAGTLEMQAGTNTNAITNNTGALSITGNVTNASGVSVTQDNISIVTLGSLIADAGDLHTVNGITNEGALSLGDGLNANDITGNGALTVTGSVTNTGNVSQKSLTNTGILVSNADLLAFADGITNSNVLNLTGGTNTNAISGIGTTNFTNDVINEGVIEQAYVNNDTGTLTNNADITATFANNGGTVNNEAVITGAITNTGTINSTADNLNGAVTNNNTLNLAGGTTQNVITGTGDTYINDDLVNANAITQNSVTNSANFTNSGLITADFINSGVVDNTNTITGAITNTGTINSVADYLNGTIANDGMLNLDGGTTQNVITGNGETYILADLVNGYTINQDVVDNAAALTNNATITATDIINSGVITGKASDLVASNEITNDGTLAFNAASTGASKISGTGNVEVTANTTLTGDNTYTGTTLIDGADLTIAGQSNIGSGDVLFANNGLLVVTAAGSLDNNLLGNTATEDVLVQNDAALTLNGTIGTAADFHKSGAGTMTLAMASNAYTGDTFVDAGTLIGNTGNINNIVNGAAGTTVEFNDTTDAELNEINTLGTFVQSGSAKLNVESNAFSANVANINAGTFAANRALTANTLNVNTGAKLQGNGNITGNVNVNTGATIAPGNSIDTLTITGDLNLAAGSTTAMEINETPASDKLVVTGNTNIASGAILTVSNENGRYFDWKTFDIVEAGNVAGTFTYDGTITDYDASRIDVEVDYSDPTKVTLTAKRKATDYAAGATEQDFSRNQRHVAQTIDKISTGHDGDITEGLLQLEKLGGLNPTGVTLINPDSTLKSALTDLSGVMYANASLTSLFNAKTAHVYDRIAKRNPASGECPTCHDNVWAEYYNQYDKVYADDNSPRFTNTMSGALVGYDRSNEKVLLGIYGGFGKSDLRQNHDTMDIDDTTAGIYMGYMPNENWIFKGTVYGGYQSYQGRRSIDFMARKTQSHYKGWNVAVDLEGSYNIALASWLNVKPFAGVLSNYSHQQHFEEKGADSLNLYVKSKDQAHTQGRLGLQLDGKVGSRFNWYASAAVKQFFGRDYSKLDMSLTLENTDMQIISAELGRTYFSGQVGVSYGITDRLSLFGNLDTGVNNKATNTYGNVGLAYTW